MFHIHFQVTQQVLHLHCQGVFLKFSSYFQKASWMMWLALVIVRRFGLQLWFIQNTDLLFWFGLELLAQKRKTNCCNNSMWTESLDSLFLLISITVWYKNLLNRKYEQTLCLWEFFSIYLFTERNQKICFSLSLSGFRNVGKVEMWQLCSSLDAFCPFV